MPRRGLMRLLPRSGGAGGGRAAGRVPPEARTQAKAQQPVSMGTTPSPIPTLEAWSLGVCDRSWTPSTPSLARASTWESRKPCVPRTSAGPGVRGTHQK